MFTCENCGETYEAREDFALSEADADGKDFMVFDGERMRDTCPKCGGLIYEKELVYRCTRQKVA